MSLKIFQKNLRFLMQKRGIDKENLQNYLRLKSDSRISAWLGGRAGPKREQLIDLCDALNYYDIYKLFTVDISKKQSVEKRVLSADVSSALTNIKSVCESILKQ